MMKKAKKKPLKTFTEQGKKKLTPIDRAHLRAFAHRLREAVKINAHVRTYH